MKPKFSLLSQEEAVKILQGPEIIDRHQKTVGHIKCQPWLVTIDKAKMMFVFWECGEGMVYEVHIASPKDSIPYCRVLTKAVLSWLFEHGASKIITSCPEGKIANLARKTGLTEIDSINGLVYFEVAP